MNIYNEKANDQQDGKSFMSSMALLEESNSMHY